MAVQATAETGAFGVSTVVKGRRNGGSSNFARSAHSSLTGCERPPKWRFKQPHRRPGTHSARVVKGRRNGGSSNVSSPGSARRGVVKGRRNGGSSNFAHASSCACRVVKGRRNGGSSNIVPSVSNHVFRCERPPKWRFKQLGEVVLDFRRRL